jgi:hypothetical protein
MRKWPRFPKPRGRVDREGTGRLELNPRNGYAGGFSEICLRRIARATTFNRVGDGSGGLTQG